MSQGKLAPSTARVPLRRKAAESFALARRYWRARREPVEFVRLFEDLDAYDRALREHRGIALADARVLEIGYGARPYRLIAMLSAGIDARGVDAEVPVLRGSPREFLAIYRCNGVERLVKSAVRHLVFDRRERRAFARALRDRDLRPWINPAAFAVGDAARYEPDGRFDLIVSEDVFEHVAIESLELLIPRMSSWLRPGGIALIQPNVFTGISGGHIVEWTHRAFMREDSVRRCEPWDHLRARRFEPNTYLNRLTRADYRERFRRHFEILEESVALPNLGRQFLTGRVAEELRHWPEEELFSNHVRFVLRSRAATDD